MKIKSIVDSEGSLDPLWTSLAIIKMSGQGLPEDWGTILATSRT